MGKILDADVDIGGIEVIIQNESDKTGPWCPHGPALLFEKNVNGKEKGRRFYACSACRDRKHCNFFQWADEKISEARMLSREEQNRSKMPFFSHQEYCSRFREFVSLPLEQRRFCVDCQLLIVPGESANHVKHRALSEDITVQRLKRPSLLLCPLDNKKSNAQYLFADWSCHFLLDMLLGSGFQKMLGHHGKVIKLRNMEGKSPTMKSLLLDIDYRHCQFYGQDEFSRYNIYTVVQEAVMFFQGFLSEEGGAKVVMVTDPPFGGLVKPLANSFSQIPKDIILPEDEGYRFCSVCERYVSAGNKHCPKHCDECGRCVKPSWRHCSSCGHCTLPDHPCGFNHGSQKHKLRACPKKYNKQMIVPDGRGAPGLLKHTAGKCTTKNKRRRTVT
uniref:rRNA N(6)-adenosine-methyltransferase ZCCHC4 n=1 Tax=Cyprinus carpio TaxID=7962 RepID=A0A8C1Y679_CYPCA